ncbi:aldo/keto reductase [Meiothermus granaticius]|nr:aldo/keto reductase [Meiothermus granaticius]MCL6525628.1 aldo/keto reductase [Thermaceae bacterium]GEM85741.1 oxidoreductase [Meiothermus granaticius NBRC 107808]
MAYRRLGNSGLHIYPIALGTMQFGWSADEAAAQAVMDAFVEAGGNLIDTADIYTVWSEKGDNPGGVSEEIIGRWMKSRRNRDQVVIATKVRGAMGVRGSEGRNSPYQREGLSRKWILKACEDSLQRLGVDYIDLYQVHWVDNQVPIEETLSALTDLVRRGYVRYIGCSNFSAWRLMQALWSSDKHGYESFVSIQPEYSLVAPTRYNFEHEIARVCETYGLGIIPYSPLAAGFLTGKYRRDQPLPQSVRAQEITHRRYSEQNWNILDKVLEIAGQRNAHPAQVALAWLLAKPQMTAPIVGANTVAQLKDLMPAAELKLSAEEFQALEEVSGWQRSRTELER